MTVQELIEQLKPFDPELEVYAESYYFYSYAPVSDVQTMTLTDEEIEIKEGFDTKQVVVITL